MAAMITEFKIDFNLPDGTKGVFHIPDEKKYPFPKPLSSAQIQGLWIITEGTLSEDIRPLPSWRIAELLKLPPSNVSSRVTTPLEKKKLIRYENKPTSRPNSPHPRKEEKVWSLNPVSMQTTYDLLVAYFMDNHFNNIIWNDTPERSISSYKHRIAMIRLGILIYLKRRIDEYENSLQWYHDHGINPPPGIASKKEHETILNS